MGAREAETASIGLARQPHASVWVVIASQVTMLLVSRVAVVRCCVFLPLVLRTAAWW
eukprot:CAMPEP_0119378264 /NCGR_PEP_ID=MMETSP1334-20130426/47524_1 /TAXON_ID=127549 /ORGANISM="Calcidiscus leptoporus, Strain RCC1130" /LENGTH=56 /DNA_ID=CAMNT_0007397401 /DNA_START=27 /DNA_END=197 /DNA_ORIENTATION=+